LLFQKKKQETATRYLVMESIEDDAKRVWEVPEPVQTTHRIKKTIQLYVCMRPEDVSILNHSDSTNDPTLQVRTTREVEGEAKSQKKVSTYCFNDYKF
jgi:hypothetical protein